MRLVMFIVAGALAMACSAQTSRPSDQIPRSGTQDSQAKQKTAPASSSGSGESSSKDSKIDLSPPKGDDIMHSDADADDDSGVMEAKPWNPHRAAKDIEVGDFYAKRKNYRAAISRYREALQYKPNDAVATFRLAQALEKIREFPESLQRYEEYLKILPKGEFAEESKLGAERVKTLAQTPPPAS